MNPSRVALAFMGLMVSIAVTDTWRQVAFLLGALAVVLYVPPGGRPKALWARVRPFYYFAGIAMVFGGLSQQDPILVIGPLGWSAEALEKAVMSGLRLVALGVAASWLTLRVGSATMVAGLWHVGRKVKTLGVDLSPVLFSMAVAIRFLPILQQEAAMLRIAWEARGANLYRGMLGRIRYTMGLIVPLLAAGLRRAEAFATAIELRIAAAGGQGLTSAVSAVFGGAEQVRTAKELTPPKFWLDRARTALALGAAWFPVGHSIVNWLR